MINKNHQDAIKEALRRDAWTVYLEANIYWINPKLTGEVTSWVAEEDLDGQVIIFTGFYPHGRPIYLS